MKKIDRNSGPRDRSKLVIKIVRAGDTSSQFRLIENKEVSYFRSATLGWVLSSRDFSVLFTVY